MIGQHRTTYFLCFVNEKIITNNELNGDWELGILIIFFFLGGGGQMKKCKSNPKITFVLTENKWISSSLTSGELATHTKLKSSKSGY